MTLRRLARSLHRWLGLGLGLWLVLAGLSGAVLVFWHSIEDWSHPATLAVTPGPTLPLVALLAAARAAHDGAEPYRVLPPIRPGEAFRAQFLPGDAGPRRTIAYVDPATARVLDDRVWRGAAIHWLYDLHDGRLAGEAGSIAVGMAGLGLALLTLAGGVLWWHRDRAPITESILPRRGLRGLRGWRNQHRAVAFWSAPLLLITALTGSALVFPGTARQLLGAMLPVAPRPASLPGTGKPVDLDGAVAAAERALPGWRAAWIDLPPRKSGEPYAMALLRPDGPPTEAPAFAVVDAATGAVEQAAPATPVEAARAWIMALHNGSAFGWGHRLLMVLLGLAPLRLALTAFAMLARRRANRRAAVPVEPERDQQSWLRRRRGARAET